MARENAGGVREALGHMFSGEDIGRSEPDEVVPQIASFGGQIIHTSLSKEAEENLRNAMAAPAAERESRERAGVPSALTGRCVAGSGPGDHRPEVFRG